MKFICIVIQIGDKMLTLSSMKNLLGLIFFNTWFTDFFTKYQGRRREKNKNKNY